jgi:hypothetical protein
MVTLRGDAKGYRHLPWRSSPHATHALIRCVRRCVGCAWSRFEPGPKVKTRAGKDRRDADQEKTMGPDPAIMHILAADRERLVQREFGRQCLGTSEVLGRPAGATSWERQVTAAVASLAATLPRATLWLSRIAGLLFVLLLIGASTLGPESPRAAAWESGAGSGGPPNPADGASCMAGMGPFTLRTSGDGTQVLPAAPWCAAHC